MAGGEPVCLLPVLMRLQRKVAPPTTAPAPILTLHPHPPRSPSTFTLHLHPHPRFDCTLTTDPGCVPGPAPTSPANPPSLSLHPPPSKDTCLDTELLAREAVASRVDMCTYIKAVLPGAAWPMRYALGRPHPQRSHTQCACIQCSSSIDTSQAEEQLAELGVSHLGQLVAQRQASGGDAKLKRLSRFERSMLAREVSEEARDSISERRNGSTSSVSSKGSF